jgi:hypothetical protein
MTCPVQNTPDLQRIAALPRRVWLPGQAEALAEQWSPHLLNADGKRLWDRAAAMLPGAREDELRRLAKQKMPIRMKPEQAMCLHEFWKHRGLFACLPVGAGKTLTSLLSFTIGAEQFGVSRGLLLVMASGERQTHDDFAALTRVWRAPLTPQVKSYEILGKPGNGYLLCACDLCMKGVAEDDEERESLPIGMGIQPELIVGDEIDLVRNPECSRSRRLNRYYRNHSDRLFVGLTGTPLRHSFRNFRKPMIWALKEGAPVPFDYATTDQIAGALDNKPREGQRRDPGALRQFVEDLHWYDAEPLEAARDGFGRRVTDTPGVIMISESSCDQPLTIRVIQAPDDSAIEQECFRAARDETSPDGWPLADPLSVMRHDTQTNCGFFSYYDPRPPEIWIVRRKAWLKHVKEQIKRSQQHGPAMDSEKEVAKRSLKHPVYIAWQEVKGLYKPEDHTKDATISLSVVHAAAKWIAANGPALVWTQHTWVGEQLARLTGLHYYGGEGKTASGSYIGDADGTQTCILSAHANRRQRNLQMFRRNLIIAPEHSAERLEQQIGRTHRYGQEHPVEVTILASGGCSVKAIFAACEEARNVQVTMRMHQKILNATWDWSQCNGLVTHPHQLPKDDIRRARWCRT